MLIAKFQEVTLRMQYLIGSQRHGNRTELVGAIAAAYLACTWRRRQWHCWHRRGWTRSRRWQTVVSITVGCLVLWVGIRAAATSGAHWLLFSNNVGKSLVSCCIQFYKKHIQQTSIIKQSVLSQLILRSQTKQALKQFKWKTNKKDGYRQLKVRQLGSQPTPLGPSR